VNALYKSTFNYTYLLTYLLCTLAMCVYIQITEESAAGEAAAAEDATGDDDGGKNRSILQIKLRKVVVLIGKAG